MAETQVIGRSWRDDAEETVELCFDDFRTFLKSSSANVSPDGIFVETEEPPPADTTVALELNLSDGHPLIRGRGAVVWARAAGDGDETPGMGIRFLNLDPASERLVGRIVEERTKAGLDVFDLNREFSAGPEKKARDVGSAEHPEPITPEPMIPTAAIDDQQAEIEALRREHAEERARWQAELAAAREAADDLNSRLRDSLSRMMATIDARDALGEELRAVQETAQQYRERVEGLDIERTRLQHELESKGAEINRWTEEAVAATTEREALEEKLAAAHDEIERLVADIEETRKRSAEETARANAELETVTSAKEEAVSGLQETETALAKLEKAAAEADGLLRRDLDEAKVELEEQHRKNEELAGESNALEQEVDRLGTELAAARERAEEIENETERFREEIARLQSWQEEMEAKAASEREAAARAVELVERVRTEHAALQDDLAEAQAAVEEIEVSRRSLETEPEEKREAVSATAESDESSEDEEQAPRPTVKTRLAGLAAKLRGGKADETYSDLMSLDEPFDEPGAEIEPDEDSEE